MTVRSTTTHLTDSYADFVDELDVTHKEVREILTDEALDAAVAYHNEYHSDEHGQVEQFETICQLALAEALFEASVDYPRRKILENREKEYIVQDETHSPFYRVEQLHKQATSKGEQTAAKVQ